MEQSLPAFVRQTREAFGDWLSQSELARRAGISSSTVSRLESGEHIPDQATLEKIAAVLGVPAETLLTLAGYTAFKPGHPIVLPAAEPLAQVERALHAGPWKPEVKAAIFTLLRETAQP